MEVAIRVYVNSDDALILWTVDGLDPSLRGFAVERTIKAGENGAGTTAYIDNYAAPGPKDYQQGVHQPSDRWPFRAFTWTDHSVAEGDEARYRVVPVLWDAQARKSEPDETQASSWSDWRTIGYAAGSGYRGYFNRGFIISQFMSRYIDEHYPDKTRVQALKLFKQEITADVEDRIRIFLSGDIRRQLLRLLDEVEQGTGEIHAALFELQDDELVDRLVKLGTRAHVVLANGAVQVKTDPKTKKAIETTVEARKRDENKAARKKLIDAHVDVEKKHRFIAPGALGHNKFLVWSDESGTPRKVWTGSTNWSTTGLCTQLNNAILVEDTDVAAAYLDQWNLLRQAGSAHPPELAIANSSPRTVGGDSAGTVRSSIHFTRENKKVDLDALAEIVNGAQQGILFLMFIPGLSGTLGVVNQLKADKPGLVIRGVVSELPKGPADERTGTKTTVRVKLVSSGAGAPKTVTKTVDVVQPEGRAHPAAYWAAETTHQQFKQGIGYAIIHSKVIVVDPFTNDPTVVAGSHNFSISASSKNDENFIVVRGDKALAEAYAVNVDSAWRHYAARVATPSKLLGVSYLDALLADRQAEASFWGLA
jgi:phosphatidylserine/phosphatidylglycerophosphate/cardiolipin synthase-like enzyme